ncbi:MAG TPA: hypothetical protein VN376_02660 [Longilinea sp.]|nr:hypothetical protein [Longilinea sp.]
MFERIIRAITFKTPVYKEVAEDPSFTTSAWLIVAVAALANQIGGRAAQLTYGRVGSFFFGVLFGTALAIGGFAVSCFLVSWLAKQLFSIDLPFEKVVRALGLAYVFNIIGILSIVAAFGVALLCITGPITLIVGIAGLIATLFALKEVTSLEWGQTVVLAVVVAIVSIVINLIVGAIFVVPAVATLY